MPITRQYPPLSILSASPSSLDKSTSPSYYQAGDMASVELVHHPKQKLLAVRPDNPVQAYSLQLLEFTRVPGEDRFVSAYHFPLISLVIRFLTPSGDFGRVDLSPEAKEAFDKELEIFGTSKFPNDEQLHKFLPFEPKSFPKAVSSYYRGSLFPSTLIPNSQGTFSLVMDPDWSYVLGDLYPHVGMGRVSLSTQEVLEIISSGGFLSHRDVPSYLLIREDALQSLGEDLKKALAYDSYDAFVTDGLPIPEGLWQHQKRGVGFLLRLAKEGYGGGYLAFDMGAGKTLTSLSFVRAVESQRTLVVCPKSVIPTWSSEAEKWFGNYFASITPLSEDLGPTRVKAEHLRISSQSTPALVVINYESLIQDDLASAAKEVGWDILILDEAHFVKNPRSKRFSTLSKLKRNFTIALSGTPMVQGPQDLWSQAYLLDPSFLGSNYYAYVNTYTIKGGYKNKRIVGYKNTERLSRKTSKFMLRVSIDDVLELPDQVFLEVPVYLSKEAYTKHDEFWRSLWDYAKAEELNLQTAATAIIRMQQVTGGFLVNPDGTRVRIDHSKEEALADLLEAIGPPEPVVVFAYFHDDLDVIHSVALKLGRTYGELSGRRNDLQAFKEGKLDVLGVQIRSGGTGVDLTRSRYAIYYSLGYSLGDYLQSLARLRRPGQTRKLIYYHLVAKDTIDERVYQALSLKQDVINSIISGIRSSL